MLLRKTFAFAAALCLAVAVTADDKKTTDKTTDKAVDDATFVQMAASSDLTEIASSKLALTKAKSDEVKKFAETMIKDHTKSSAELKAAAKAAGVDVPAKMTEKHAKALEELAKATDFDAAYIKQQVTAHQEAVELYTAASKGVKSKELKDFATKTLPVIQGHLEHVKKMSAGK